MMDAQLTYWVSCTTSVYSLLEQQIILPG